MEGWATTRRRRAPALALAGLGLLALGGCGGSKDDYANTPRPPVPITVTAAISDDEIALSPASFGAGPVTLIITNQTDDSVELELETERSASGEAGIRQQTGPINPTGTAQLTVALERGTYSLKADSDDIEPAELRVGAKRASGQDQLLLP